MLTNVSRSRITQVYAVLFLILSALTWQFRASVAPHVAFIPAHTFVGEHAFWNLVTGAFVEISPIKWVLDFVSLLALGPAVQASIGAKNMLLLTAIAVACSALTTLILSLFWVALLGGYRVLYTPLPMSTALLGALAVAYVRSVGTIEVLPLPAAARSVLPGTWSMRAVLPLNLGLAVLGQLAGATWNGPIAALGIAYGWMYIRFFLVTPSTAIEGVRGDRGADFEFHMLWPLSVQPVVKALAMPVRMACGGLPCFAPAFALVLGEDDDAAAHPAGPALFPTPLRHAAASARQFLGSNMPGTAGSRVVVHPGAAYGAGRGGAPGARAQHAAPDPVAERRRARALKLLDQRLAAMAGPGVGVALDAGADSPAKSLHSEMEAAAAAPPAAQSSAPSKPAASAESAQLPTADHEAKK